VDIAPDLLNLGTKLNDTIDELHEFLEESGARRSVNFTRVLLESLPDE